jgi:hypothetical protein
MPEIAIITCRCCAGESKSSVMFFPGVPGLTRLKLQVWQLVKMALQKRVSIQGMPELIALSRDDEGVGDLMRLHPR